MDTLNTHYLIYSLISLIFASHFTTLFASVSATGDAGLHRLIERNQKHTKRLLFWKKRWNLICITTRIFMSLSGSATFIFSYLTLQHCSRLLLFSGLFLLILLYVLTARIVPQILAESYADKISLRSLPLIGLLTYTMYIFVWPLQKIEKVLLSHAMRSSDEEDRPSPEDEIKSLIDETDTEELEEEERKIIRSVFEFDDTITREIMTPRINISGLKDSLTIKESIAQIKGSPHSRFPVYHENIDDVVGVVHVKDLLNYTTGDDAEKELSKVAKKILFVPESMPINELMKLMKKSHTQAVLVVDEYGGTEGLVTMEDIIEELVGEIEDEYDLKEKEIQKRADGSFVVNARVSISELNEELNLVLPESDEYDSLGGFIIFTLGRIPRAGETLQAANHTLKIQNATHRQIQAIQMIPDDLK